MYITAFLTMWLLTQICDFSQKNVHNVHVVLITKMYDFYVTHRLLSQKGQGFPHNVVHWQNKDILIQLDTNLFLECTRLRF